MAIDKRLLHHADVLARQMCRKFDQVSTETRLTIFMRAFEPRPSDIFISSYPRSGTTWTQMILYQLTTDGRMDFEHFYEVSPWFERMALWNVSLDEIQRHLRELPSPRIFKTHLPYARLRNYPARYVYVHRDGRDVAMSNYHFVPHDASSYETFFERYFLKGGVYGALGSWFDHVADWRANAAQRSLLCVSYESLQRDLPSELRRIARFCEVDGSDARLAKVAQACAFANMKQHEAKLSANEGRAWEARRGHNTFLREGRVGAGRDSLSQGGRDAYRVALARAGLLDLLPA